MSYTIIWAFIQRFWRVILLSVILTAYLYEKHAHNAAVQALEAYKQNIQLAVAKQQAENAKLVADAKKDSEKQRIAYEAEIKSYQLDRNKLRSELNEKISRNDSLLNAVWVWQQRANSGGQTKDTPLDAGILPEARRDSDSTIIALTKAGQSCAIDYKNLYEFADRNCKNFGCE